MRKLLLFIATIWIFSSCTSQLNIDHLFSSNGWDIQSTDKYDLYKLFSGNGDILASGYGNGNIYKADSNGKWKKLTSLSPEYIEEIQFVNGNTAFACGDYGYVYKSVNGGINWQESGPQIYDRITERYREVDGANKSPAGIFISYNDMYFANASHGYISGFMYKPQVKQSNEALNYVTKDGGKTWTYVAPAKAEAMKNEVINSATKTYLTAKDKYYYLDDTHRWLSYYDKKFGHQVGRSTDGGKTWAYSPRPESKHGDWTETGKIFVNSTKGFLFGGTKDGKMGVGFYSIDGGETWKEMAVKWPYINDALLSGGKIYLSGKQGKLLVSKT